VHRHAIVPTVALPAQALPAMADCGYMQTLRAWTRRVTRTAVLAGAYLVLASFSPVTAAPEPVATPLARLKSGNDRFVRGLAAVAPSRTTAAGDQTPFAMVLSCADQRQAVELVFGAAPGDLFVARSPGEVVDRAVIAGLEHAVAEMHVPLLVVMGHDTCAIVQAAQGEDHPGSANLEFLYRAIRAGTSRSAADRADVRALVLANVEQVINDTLSGSPAIRAAAAGGHLQIVGAYFDAGTGAVVFSDPVDATSVPHK